MTAAPLIHGAAQLGTWIALLQGWKACLVPRFEPHAVWKTVQDEKVLALSIVGDAMARPLAEALDEASYDLAGFFVMSSAGAVWTQPVKDQLKAKLPNLVLLDNFGASETGAQGMDAGGVQAEGGIRFRMNPNTVVLDDDNRVIEPGSGTIGKLALRGRVPLGYWKDEAKSARTFVTIDGVRHVLIGDLARPEADGTVTVFGRGSQCINSAARRSSRGGRGRPQVARGRLRRGGGRRPRRALGRSGGGADPVAPRLPCRARGRGRALPQARRRLQGAALAVRRRRDRPLPERQTRLPLGKEGRGDV
jgi:acyl-CoA synthetase (AMP-forming)/AMP-acid ligase II